MKEIALLSSTIPNLNAWYVIAFIFILIFILGMYALKNGKNIKISSQLFNIETTDKKSNLNELKFLALYFVPYFGLTRFVFLFRF